MTATAKINKRPWGYRLSRPSKLDPAKYGRLLAETLPAVITNESEYDRVAAPHEVIQLLMQEHSLRNKDLEPALGSRGVTSEVISGKRKPSKTQIKKLAEFFGVAPAVFISLD